MDLGSPACHAGQVRGTAGVREGNVREHRRTLGPGRRTAWLSNLASLASPLRVSRPPCAYRLS